MGGSCYEQIGVSCVYESCTNHRPQSREAQSFGLYQKFDPSFISWNQQSPDHATQRRRPLAAQVPRSHSRATDQSFEFRTPALDRGISSFFLSSFFRNPWQELYSRFVYILRVCYIENHVFLGTGIDQKFSARHVFFIADAQLRASSSCATPNSFFIGSHGQELSVPRNSTLIRMPRNTGIGILS